MTSIDRNMARILFVFYDIASILAVYDTEWRSYIPAHMDGTHIANEPNRAPATWNKVCAVRGIHFRQFHPCAFMVLLTDTR